MQRVTHKRGATFEAACVRKDAAGTRVDLTGWTITSHMRRRSDQLVQQLVTSLADQVALPGVFTLTATAAQTAAWPVEVLLWDIRYQPPTGVEFTETVEVDVQREITRASS